MTHRFHVVCLSLVGFLLLGGTASAEPPRLVVQVVVDQLSMAQLDRAEDLLSSEGLGRLLAQGTVARDARYMGAPTVTAHGHATLATGTYGATHGIVGNTWHVPGKGEVYVCHDPEHRLLTRATTARDCTSPVDLRAPTFADALKWSRPGAKVVTLSLKDRSAVLSGGGRPDAAVWYDAATDRWTTSTWYGKALPAWVPAGAVSEGVDAWHRLADPSLCKLLPKQDRPKAPGACVEALYETRAGPDDDPAEHGSAGFGPTFPHRLPEPGEPTRGRLFRTTPLADQALFELGMRALEHAELGRDTHPDLLVISASGFDSIGHDFGPESQESLDALLRLDRTLAAFMRALDRYVGKGRWVLALSADHGVMPTTAKAAARGLSARHVDLEALRTTAQEALVEAGLAAVEVAPFANVGLSFATPPRPADRERAERVVAEAVLSVDGVAMSFPGTLLGSGLSLEGHARRHARSWYRGRSPDVVVLPRPLWTFEDVASHGTSYLADSRVPFIIYRGGRAPAAVDGPIDVASLTPTLALIAGSAPPAAADAPILTEVARALK